MFWPYTDWYQVPVHDDPNSFTVYAAVDGDGGGSIVKELRTKKPAVCGSPLHGGVSFETRKKK
jgi:hypothetical protein